jgi:hypothetical protein
MPKKLVALKGRLPNENYNSEPRIGGNFLPPISNRERRSSSKASLKEPLRSGNKPKKSINTEEASQAPSVRSKQSSQLPRKCLSKDEKLFVLQPKVLDVPSYESKRYSVLKQKLRLEKLRQPELDYEQDLFGGRRPRRSSPDSHYEHKQPCWWG